MDRRCLAVLLLVILLAACEPPQWTSAPTRFFALNLPVTPSLADADGQPLAGVFRSVRLLLDNQELARSHTIVGETETGQQLSPGHSLGMAFSAPRAFMGVAVSLQRIGPGPVQVGLTLRRGSRHGSVVASRVVESVPQRGWAELRFEEQPPGRYHVQLSECTGAGVFWRGQALTSDPDNLWQDYRERSIPFKLPQTLDAIPQYDSSSLSILVNTRAARIYFLGGRSSYDHGIASWGDYEARGDATDRQFVGDRAGNLEIAYADGSRDVVPLMFGLNLWWWNHWGNTEGGGPFLQPFLATPRPMIASLHIYSLGDNALAPSFWVFQPQDKTITRLRFVDNPDIQGFPLVVAVTLEGQGGGPNASPLPSPDREESFTAWLADHTISAQMLASDSYDQALAALRSFLYSTPASIPDSLSREEPMDPLPVRLSFSGSWSATILSNVHAHSLKDLLAKLTPAGMVHSSTAASPNYGGYGGIGTWRAGVGYFHGQAWTRDTGRALIELARLGFLDQVEAALAFAGTHLYDLPNGYPEISRQGQRVPPHWGTVLGAPNLMDVDSLGDDNQENDGHGLLLLAHVRAWHARAQDRAWLDRYWPVIRDAAEWYCFQLENPAFSRATSVLYTEGEAANDGGYDVYSNVIAVEALRGAADMAHARHDAVLARRWEGCADTIASGLRQELTDHDERYGTTWRPVAWGWGYGHESLAPAFIQADRSGYLLAASETLSVTLSTYQRQTQLPSGFRSGRVLGYGQAFLAQAALMLDDMTGAGEALDNLARFIYDGRAWPYLVPEGIALHPSSSYWYRTGDLGNAVQEAEVLKTLALVAGVDDLSGQRLVLMPRLPPTWSGISVADYPVTVAGKRLTVGYTLTGEARRVSIVITASSAVPLLDVRLGPLPVGASPQVFVDGAIRPAEVVESGGWGWVWLRNMQNRERIGIEVRW